MMDSADFFGFIGLNDLRVLRGLPGKKCSTWAIKNAQKTLKGAEKNPKELKI